MAVAPAHQRLSARLCDLLLTGGWKLRGRRRSRSAVKRKSVARRNLLREPSVSGDQLGCGDEVESRRGQHGHVQRLADVASSIRAIIMLVQEAAARREIQQHRARQHRERPARQSPSEDSSAPLHPLLF
jgi:hypothetical protein